MRLLKIISIGILCLTLFRGNAQTTRLKNEKEQHDSSTNKKEEQDHMGANKYMNKRSSEDLVKSFEDPERIKTQKPDEVIASLGDINGKTIMDIGAGTGYFTFKMARKGAKVIAADVDERFIGYIKQKRDSLKITSSVVETRLVPYDDCKLANAEVDIVIIVNTYHHIANRVDYFRKVKQGLKINGKLLVLEFKKIDVPMSGPPVSMKVAPTIVKEELRQAGFTKFLLDEKLMPYHYTIIAQ